MEAAAAGAEDDEHVLHVSAEALPVLLGSEEEGGAPVVFVAPLPPFPPPPPPIPPALLPPPLGGEAAGFVAAEEAAPEAGFDAPLIPLIPLGPPPCPWLLYCVLLLQLPVPEEPLQLPVLLLLLEWLIPLYGDITFPPLVEWFELLLGVTPVTAAVSGVAATSIGELPPGGFDEGAPVPPFRPPSRPFAPPAPSPGRPPEPRPSDGRESPSGRSPSPHACAAPRCARPFTLRYGPPPVSWSSGPPVSPGRGGRLSGSSPAPCCCSSSERAELASSESTAWSGLESIDCRPAASRSS